MTKVEVCRSKRSYTTRKRALTYKNKHQLTKFLEPYHCDVCHDWHLAKPRP